MTVHVMKAKVLIEYKGRIQGATAWAREIGITYPILRWRLRHWSLEKALITPKQRRQRSRAGKCLVISVVLYSNLFPFLRRKEKGGGWETTYITDITDGRPPSRGRPRIHPLSLSTSLVQFKMNRDSPMRGRSHAEMMDMKAARGPYSDPRDGRLQRQIRLSRSGALRALGHGSPKKRRLRSRRCT